MTFRVYKDRDGNYLIARTYLKGFIRFYLDIWYLQRQQKYVTTMDVDYNYGEHTFIPQDMDKVIDNLKKAVNRMRKSKFTEVKVIKL